MRGHRIGYLLTFLALAGCASPQTPGIVNAPPIPDDIAWTRPRPAAGEPEVAPQLRPVDRPASPHEQVFPYEEGREYTLKVGLDVPLNIWLQPGEVYDLVQSGYRRPIAAGEQADEPTWEIKTAKSGEGPNERWHVTVTVTKTGLTNGLDILTNRRTYALRLQSVERAKYRVVRWTYPH
jgi:type IV secretory pathway VirB9-like protein